MGMGYPRNPLTSTSIQKEQWWHNFTVISFLYENNDTLSNMNSFDIHVL